MSAKSQTNGYEITKWAEGCDVGSSSTRKFILVLLALKCNPKSKNPGWCYSKQQTLAEVVGCHRETVGRCLDALAFTPRVKAAEGQDRSPRSVNAVFAEKLCCDPGWPLNSAG